VAIGGCKNNAENHKKRKTRRLFSVVSVKQKPLQNPVEQ
jgi:hypothetical protein